MLTPPYGDAAELPMVVIDPGHGGHDPGAISAQKVQEKAITLAIAKLLKQHIEKSGIARVELTRSTDVFLPIEARVEFARKRKARLMISLHADSLEHNPFIGQGGSENARIRGATLYTMSETASDPETAAYAERENNADVSVGTSTPQESATVHDILTELMTRETHVLSQHFASSLMGELKPFVNMSKIPLRSARFRVLKAPDVPSVLFEMGYLSNVEDAKLLTSDIWRGAIATATTQAVKGYVGR